MLQQHAFQPSLTHWHTETYTPGPARMLRASCLSLSPGALFVLCISPTSPCSSLASAALRQLGAVRGQPRFSFMLSGSPTRVYPAIALPLHPRVAACALFTCDMPCMIYHKVETRTPHFLQEQGLLSTYMVPPGFCDSHIPPLATTLPEGRPQNSIGVQITTVHDAAVAAASLALRSILAAHRVLAGCHAFAAADVSHLQLQKVMSQLTTVLVWRNQHNAAATQPE